jgi:hypothetical protein
MKRDLSRVVNQIPLVEEVMWSGKEKWRCLFYLNNYKKNRPTEEWVQYFVHQEGARV